MRKTTSDDKGRKLHRQKILTERTGVKINFADAHSRWQRGFNENPGHLLRQ
jgi:IS30 family transposase